MYRWKDSSRLTVLKISQMTDIQICHTHCTNAAVCPLSIVFGSALQWFYWRKMIIIADEARAPNDDSVTAESFLICRIRLWHAPSQDAGNLFICAEERGKGGQLASTIRQPSDKQYITAWDSQTNERGSSNVHPGWTEFCNHPATLITCTALDIRILYSHMLRGVTPHIYCLPHHCARCHMRSGLLKGTSVMSNVILQNHVHQHYIKCMQFTVIHALLHGYILNCFFFLSCHWRMIS